MSAAVERRAESRAPLRGTQSFVGVMLEVWKRPGWTGLEVLWRWLVGVLVLAWPLLELRPLIEDALAGHGISFAFSPTELLGRHWAPVALLLAGVWIAASAVGRRMLLRHLGTRRLPLGTSLVLTAVRVVAFGVVLGGWFAASGAIVRRTHVDLKSWSTEPGFVAAFAGIVVVTLVAFVFWALVSWTFRLAPVLAAAEGLGPGRALASVGRNKELRSKLIEVNLVMGIVKVALLVLAMVFSACPLPFQAVATPQFMLYWSAAVAVWYLIASDFFHVVRLAAYVRLHEALAG